MRIDIHLNLFIALLVTYSTSTALCSLGYFRNVNFGSPRCGSRALGSRLGDVNTAVDLFIDFLVYDSVTKIKFLVFNLVL